MLNVECRNNEENTDEEEDDDKINKVKFQERLKRQKIQVSLSDHLKETYRYKWRINKTSVIIPKFKEEKHWTCKAFFNQEFFIVNIRSI